MGHMTRDDDVRLDGEEGGLELSRESFCVRFTHGSGTIEIAYSNVARLRKLLDIAMAHGAGEGEKQPPTQEQAKAWQKVETDTQLLQAAVQLTDRDLESVLRLRERGGLPGVRTRAARDAG